MEIQGSKELQAIIKKMKASGDKQLQAMLAEGAIDTDAEAKRLIASRQSRGREYKRGRISHIASTAGNPPNTDTGRLIRSVKIMKISGGYDVGSRQDAPHGLWLEFGTSKMAARPWLSVAYNKIIKPLIEKYSRKGLL